LLLEQLKGRVHVPTVLFYPGALDGAAGLRFMGVLDAEHNYRWLCIQDANRQLGLDLNTQRGGKNG